MKDKDSQLIFEKYQQIQEASPIGLGQRLGNWAKRKVASALPTFTGDWKHRLEGEKQSHDELIELKRNFEKFKGRYKIKSNAVTGRHLYTFLKTQGYHGMAFEALGKKLWNTKLSEKDIIKIMLRTHQQQGTSGKYIKHQKPQVTQTPQQNKPQPKP